MRVAQVSLRFDAPGGVETNVLEVSRLLRRKGVDVDVFTSDLYDEAAWERRTGFRPEVDGVPVHRFPVYRRLLPGLTMPLMVGLVGALDRARPDVIHAHSHRYGHVLEAAAVAQARKLPLVVSTHYHPADRREPAWKRGLLRLQDVGFGLTAYRVARALVVETQREAGLLREFAPGERIRVIPPGVDLEAWTSTAGSDRPPLGLPDGFVLYAGRIASNKGLSFLLAALARLPENRRPPLVLLGRDWGERARLEEEARRLGVAGQVRFLGQLEERSQYRAVFRRARLFVLPSEWEAFGLVLLEAMAAGCPVLATEVGGVPEVLEGGRAGALVPYGDPAALAREIERLLADRPAALALARAGRARVEGLTWEAAADRHAALYAELAEGSASA